MSCCRLFTWTSWLMYWLGSLFAVGSWFFISATSNDRKSLAVMLAEPLVPEDEVSAGCIFAVTLLADCSTGFTCIIPFPTLAGVAMSGADVHAGAVCPSAVCVIAWRLE